MTATRVLAVGVVLALGAVLPVMSRHSRAAVRQWVNALRPTLPRTHRRRALIAAGALLTTLVTGPAQGAPSAVVGHCEPSVIQRPDATEVTLGSSIGIDISFDPGCSSSNLPRHYMLVLGPWSNPVTAFTASRTLTDFLAALSPASAAGAVLGDQADPRWVAPGFRRDTVANALHSFRPSSADAALSDLVRTAHNAYASVSDFLSGISRLPAGRRHIVILASRELRLGSERSLRFDVDLDREIGIEINLICVGGGCPTFDGIQTIDVADLPAAGRTLAELDARPAPTELEWLRLRAQLAGTVAYDFDTARPTPDRLGLELGSAFVAWAAERPVQVGPLSYRVRPQVSGSVPVAGSVEVEGMTSAGFPVRYTGPAPSAVLVHPRPERPSACSLRAAARAAPDPVVLGATASLSLTLLADCPPGTREVDAVLAIDRSASMLEGQRLAKVQAAARAFAESIDLAHARVAVLAFGSQVDTLVDLTQDREALLAAIEAVTAEGDTDMAGGIRRARQILDDRRPGALPVVVLLSDGVVLDAPQPEADWAHVAGIRLVAVCVNDSEACQRRYQALASPPSYFLATTDTDLLARFYGDLGAYLGRADFDELVLTHTPFPVFPFIGAAPGQASPRRDAQGRLTWQRADPLLGRSHLEYRLNAEGPGRWPVAEAITAVWRDSEGGVGMAFVNVPELTVLGPEEEGPCWPEEIERSASSERVGLDELVLSHLDFRLACQSQPVPLEVAVVVDHSFSMRGERMADARAAVDALLAETMAVEARFALVAFSNVILAQVPLTEDREAIRSRLGQLTPTGETNIGLAIDTAVRLLDPSRPGARRFLVLLTDGFNSAGARPIPAAAGEARERGIEIIAVCAGGICDPALRTAVSQPGFFFDVPDGSGLAGLFERIGRALAGTRPIGLVVQDQPGPALVPVPGGSIPEPMGGPNPDVWAFGFPGDNLTSISRQLLARQSGRQPLSLWTRLDYTTADGGLGSLYAPAAAILIDGETDEPGPTALPLPSATPTQVATNTPQPTPTAAPRPSYELWLPRLDRP